jgi:hypothetical protein
MHQLFQLLPKNTDVQLKFATKEEIPKYFEHNPAIHLRVQEGASKGGPN